MAKKGPSTLRGYQEYRCRDGVWRPPRSEGIGRVLAKAGYGSRQRAEAIVADGRVWIDGSVVQDPGQSVDRSHEILIDGKVLREVPRRYLVLHKPVGYDCQEMHGSWHWIGQFYPNDAIGIEPAGRLGAHGAGLLLLSNDQRWNTRIAGAADMERRYEVLVSGTVSDIELDVLRAGMNVPGQGMFKPRRLDVGVQRSENTLVTIAVRSDHARKVRAVFVALRHEVLSVVRTGLGPVSLDSLPSGHCRDLDLGELHGLARV